MCCCVCAQLSVERFANSRASRDLTLSHLHLLLVCPRFCLGGSTTLNLPSANTDSLKSSSLLGQSAGLAWLAAPSKHVLHPNCISPRQCSVNFLYPRIRPNLAASLSTKLPSCQLPRPTQGFQPAQQFAPHPNRAAARLQERVVCSFQWPRGWVDKDCTKLCHPLIFILTWRGTTWGRAWASESTHTLSDLLTCAVASTICFFGVATLLLLLCSRRAVPLRTGAVQRIEPKLQVGGCPLRRPFFEVAKSAIRTSVFLTTTSPVCKARSMSKMTPRALRETLSFKSLSPPFHFHAVTLHKG